jgi:hypothetical protein
VLAAGKLFVLAAGRLLIDRDPAMCSEIVIGETGYEPATARPPAARIRVRWSGFSRVWALVDGTAAALDELETAICGKRAAAANGRSPSARTPA